MKVWPSSVAWTSSSVHMWVSLQTVATGAGGEPSGFGTLLAGLEVEREPVTGLLRDGDPRTTQI